MSAEIEAHKAKLADARKQLSEAKAKNTADATPSARPKKPAQVSGKPGILEARCSHMDSYLLLTDPDEACRIVCSYLDGTAFNLGHMYRRTTAIPDWATFRAVFIGRFSPPNET